LGEFDTQAIPTVIEAFEFDTVFGIKRILCGERIPKCLVEVVLIDLAVIVVLGISQAAKVQHRHLVFRQRNAFEVKPVAGADFPQVFNPFGDAHVIEHFHGPRVQRECARRTGRPVALFNHPASHPAAQQFMSKNESGRPGTHDQHFRLLTAGVAFFWHIVSTFY
jgi:hypothetical protein